MRRKTINFVDYYLNLPTLEVNKTYIITHIQIYEWNSSSRCTNSTILWYTFLNHFNAKNSSNIDIVNVYGINEFISPVILIDLNNIKYQVHVKFWSQFQDIFDGMIKKQNDTFGKYLPATVTFKNDYHWTNKMKKEIGCKWFNMLQRRGAIYSKL